MNIINDFLNSVWNGFKNYAETKDIWIVVFVLFIAVLISLLSKKNKKSKRQGIQTKSRGKRYPKVDYDKGIRGEYLLYQELNLNPNLLQNEKYILRNVYIPKPNGGTSEIDLLLIHESGIYVFENKNYSGWIFGDEYKDYWTQTLNGGRRGVDKNKFYNPIKQNRSHVRNLRNYLQIPEEKLPIHSIVVFGDSCEFKNLTLSGSTPVIYLKDVTKVVSEIVSKDFPVLSAQEVIGIYEKLLPLTQLTQEEKVAHVEQIAESKAQAEALKSQNICPRCGSSLVLRTAKKGVNANNQFLGCSNYPKCRFTMEL